MILRALSPRPGVASCIAHGAIGFIVLGSVFLAVTGAEALYADMGHFGRRPIQAAWLFLVLPALICNYLGQGALILSDPKRGRESVLPAGPELGLVPLILLSTAATVIASQAVITGAYSLASQAIQLGLLPRLEIVHTSSTQEGQIFIPRVNRVLLLGVLGLVLLFRSSDASANAYGIAVSGTMVATTALAFFVVWKLWKWPLWGALALVVRLPSIDIGFFIANLYKVVDGGWVPLTLGAAMFILMWTWSRGSAIFWRGRTGTRSRCRPDQDAAEVEASEGSRNRSFLTNDPTSAPSSLMHNLKHNKVLHERVVLLNVRTETTPRVPAAKRFEMTSCRPISCSYPSFRLHGAAAHSARARGDAQGRAQVRHHDDVVLPRPAYAEDRAQLGHAAMAGQTVHRDDETGGERAGLLQPALRPRGRTRRADEGVGSLRRATRVKRRERMKVYVINLDRDPERLAHMREQLRWRRLRAISAVDGSTRPADDHRV